MATGPEAHATEPAITWPEPLLEDFSDKEWPNLNASNEEVEKWVLKNKKVTLRTVTWNLCAKPPPNKEVLNRNLIPLNKFHVYVIGTEECERSIAQSAINPSKKNWELFLKDTLGPRYVPLRSHTLQAIHIMAFAHEGIAHLCSVATSAAVAVGVGNTLGNKGAVGVLLRIGSSKIVVVNAHLSAHQNAVKQRNAEFHKIDALMPAYLLKKESFYNGGGSKPSLPLPDASQLIQKETVSTANKSSTNPTQTSVPTVPQDDTPTPGTESSTAESKIKQTPDKVFEAGKSDSVAVSVEKSPEDKDTSSPPESAAADASKESSYTAVENESNSDKNEKTSKPGLISNTVGESGNKMGQTNDEDSDDGEEEPEPVSPSPISENTSNIILASKALDQIADAVIFMGDLNYRIKGNRSVIDKLLTANMYEVMMSNDQLRTSMQAGLVFQKYIEGPLHFKPTYKFDLNSDAYDSSSKQRIPSWTDRILYAQNDSIACLAYNADTSVKTSDHRPVYASFLVQINTYVEINEQKSAVLPTKTVVKFTSESQVCNVC